MALGLKNESLAASLPLTILMSGWQNNDSANETKRQLEEALRLPSTHKSRAQLPAAHYLSEDTDASFDGVKKARGMVKKE